MHTTPLSLDPRKPMPMASVVQTEKGPALCTLVGVADMTDQILEMIADRVADKVVEKMTARENSVIQSLPK